jgi:hypothetical protein
MTNLFRLNGKAVEFVNCLDPNSSAVPVERSIWQLNRWSYKGHPDDHHRIEQEYFISRMNAKGELCHDKTIWAARSGTLNFKRKRKVEASSLEDHVKSEPSQETTPFQKDSWKLTHKDTIRSDQPAAIHMLASGIPELRETNWDYTINLRKEETNSTITVEKIDEYVERMWKINYKELTTQVNRLKKSESPPTTAAASDEGFRSQTNVFLRSSKRIVYTVGAWYIHLSSVSEYWDLPPKIFRKFKDGEVPDTLWNILCSGQHTELEFELNMDLLAKTIPQRTVQSEEVMQTLARELLILLTVFNLVVSRFNS